MRKSILSVIILQGPKSFLLLDQEGLYLIFYKADSSFEVDVTIQMIFVEEGDYYKIGGSWFDSKIIQEN